MLNLWKKSLSVEDLRRRGGDLRQFGQVQLFELLDGAERGVRCAGVRSPSGLDFTVLLERGMGLYDLNFRGVPLAFLSPLGAVHPAFSERAGLGWLRTWPGGFSTPCGLTQVGSPDVDNGQELGIHGRAASLPAGQVQTGSGWKGEAAGSLWVEGTMREASFFGDNLLWRRRISAELERPVLTIQDWIENQGDSPSPLMFLQHFNLGYPLLDSSSQLRLPEGHSQARDEEALPGLEICRQFCEPQDGYNEQVFYHDLQAGSSGQVEIRLENPAFAAGAGLGLAMRFSKADYPVLVEWKMMRAGTYVLGLEPANCRVGGRRAEREAGTLQTIAPGEMRTFTIEIEFFGG